MSEVKGKKIVLLISGGPDSKTLAKWIEKEGGQTIAALYLRSGHETDDHEIEAAKKIAAQHGIRFDIADISALVKKLGGERIVMHAATRLMEFGSSILLSIAVAYAMRSDAQAVAIAVHRDDANASRQYGQAFLDQFNRLATLAYPDGPTVLAPFIGMSKPEVFALGASLGVEYSGTWSCTTAGPVHCGTCGACEARKRAFHVASLVDPTEYTDMLARAYAVAGA